MAADVVEAAVEAVIGFLGRWPSDGYYEAVDEAVVQAHHIIRHVEAVIELARRDLVLLGPAAACARAGFESAVRSSWLLHPAEPMQREARYLTMLSELEKYYRVMRDEIGPGAPDPALHGDPVREIEELRLGIERQLPQGIRPLDRLPSIMAMLDEIGRRDNYVVYRMCSQFVHGSIEGGMPFRRHLGNAKEFGTFAEPSMWQLPLGLGWHSIALWGSSYGSAVGAKEPFPTELLKHTVQPVLASLA